ncbi:MAG: hypothetical protein ACRDF0_11260 [Candidatus Limnocylindria bacterium]
MLAYERPAILDLGSIADHTFNAGGSGTIKGGVLPNAHLDIFCELSSGLDPNVCGGAGKHGR